MLRWGERGGRVEYERGKERERGVRGKGERGRGEIEGRERK